MAALVRREAVALVETFEELVDTAELLVRFPRPPAKGAAIITNSGAFKGYALDFADTIGLDLPLLAPATAAAIKEVVPPFATVDNPLDVTAQTMRDPSILGRSAVPLARRSRDRQPRSPRSSPATSRNAVERMEHFLSLAATSEKPLVVAALGDESPLMPGMVEAIRARGLAFFRSPDRAMRAMAHVVRYARALENADRKAAAKLPAGEAAGHRRHRRVSRQRRSSRRSASRCRRARWPRRPTRRRRSRRGIGYPVVLKAQAARCPTRPKSAG